VAEPVVDIGYSTNGKGEESIIKAHHRKLREKQQQQKMGQQRSEKQNLIEEASEKIFDYRRIKR
jgi:hypothetical protein